jgi:hypothetical protein
MSYLECVVPIMLLEEERECVRVREQGRCLSEFILQANINLGHDLASLA